MTDINDAVKMTGKVTLKHYDETGKLVQEQTVNNMIVTAGRNHIASRMIGTTPSATQMTHMALGSSSTSPALSDTALGTQLGSRVGLTGGAGVVSGNTITYTASFAAGAATGAIVEAGIFDASTAGNMLCRTTFSVINKGSNDTLAVTWVVTIS